MRIIQPIIYSVLHSGHHEETRIDGKSYDLMLEIQKELSVFEPIEDDEARMIWLDIPRGTAEEWKAFNDERYGCSDDEEDSLASYEERLTENYDRETEWFFLVTSTYRENTFLKISDRCHEYAIFTNRDMDNHGYGWDMTWFLRPLLELVKQKVKVISLDPDAYNRHVEQHLPYRQRDGRIKSSILNRIIPERRLQVKDREHCIEIMRELVRRKKVYDSVKKGDSVPSDFWKKNNVPAPFEEMTIRRFCHYYRIANILFWTESESDKKKRAEITDGVEYYKSFALYDSLEEYDLDSVADFRRFAKDHYGELGFSRMNIHGSDYYAGGKWLISFGISYSAYVDTGLEIAMALYESGAPFIYHEAETTLHVLEETGWIRLSPHYFHDYLEGGDDEGIFPLPFVEYCGEEEHISRAQYDEIVRAAKWEPQEKLILDHKIPLDDEVYSLIRDEVDEPITLSEIRHRLENRFKTYLSVNRQDGFKGYYYFAPSNAGKYSDRRSKKNYPTFNEALRALILEMNKININNDENEDTIYE